jgi:hypothetical protein
MRTSLINEVVDTPGGLAAVRLSLTAAMQVQQLLKQASLTVATLLRLIVNFL